MLALTLHRPWPWAIFFAGKCVENRNWPPPRDVIGTRIAIHAGKTWDTIAPELIGSRGLGTGMFGAWEDTEECLEQGIVGTVRLVGVVKERRGEPSLIAGAWGETAPPRCVPWFGGRYGWLVDQRRVLDVPIPCRGNQGLWRVPDDIAARLSAASERPARPGGCR